MSKTTKFSHKFSGISVWLEPDPAQGVPLVEEMDYLMDQCGGPEAGMHRIIPHCTLLYNTSFPSTTVPLPLCNEDNVKSTHRWNQKQQHLEGEDLLRQCLREYRIRRKRECCNCSSETPSRRMDANDNSIPRTKMIPTSHYYFPYPRTADDGKGFGCCISLLILETSPELQLLHDVVKNVFPPDERHGGKGDEHATGEEEEEEEKKEDETIRDEVKFQPHMALIYAPEDHENVVNGWLEDRTLQMEKQKQYLEWISTANRLETSENDNGDNAQKNQNQKEHGPAAWDARYLSIWSTEGTLDEWFPIAKIDLFEI
mmetsp:Transcript_6280/g.11191  ORF Transcript_6280/g.11191 Transcript_6280/m.11191 type:complete len:314 (+) Transcript_6280:233-1174(+)|eukprot:CAMPEP_0183776514 /NCGR_PEP_ID=MMETSP0739-20130205/47055_1 /TAXON_ID=385413 /ORGANISM="Thalassiosira miniscula, Strain CCMP1093" /LENGTH=313 /DNA_ID=CAMNT_0026018399 /DNA_START=165 /DNA_END=1106 /DNA_ORIENTATION=+